MVIPPAKVENWVATNFPDYKTRRGGAELVINNPFNYDTGYHFNISVEKGVCHDWRGDSDWVGYQDGKRRGCTFLRFVQLYRNCSFAEAYKEVLGSAYTPEPHKGRCLNIVQENPALKLPDGASPLAEDNGKMARILKNWLASRGITEAAVKQYRLMYAGPDVIWPYYEFDDEPVYWQSRSAINKTFRFPSASLGVNRSDFIYGFDHVELATTVTITEAIFDAITIKESCVASGGAALSMMQAKKINMLHPIDGITLAPDNDNPGIKSILENAKILSQYKYPIYYSIPPKLDDNTKDWNDVGKHVGFDNVHKVMMDNRTLLSMSEKMKLRSIISRKPYDSI